MKGLLLKDLINLKQQSKVFLMIVALWLVMSIAQKDASFFGGVMMIFSVMLPITAMAYDERAKCDRYALTMPISRKDMVISKYLLGLLLIGSSIVLTGVLNIFLTGSFVELFLSAMGFLSVGLIFLAVIMPLMFKFGVEKGRMTLMLVALIPAIFVFLLPNLNLPKPDDQLLSILAGAAPLAGLILLGLSMLISVKIYSKKEV